MSLIIGFLLFLLAQSLIWLQIYGQFIWPWFNRNPILVAFGLGGIISYILIRATRFVVEHFEGLIWPSRFIGFSSGILMFTIMTYLLMKEGVSMKTAICLVLALAIVVIQVFWK